LCKGLLSIFFLDPLHYERKAVFAVHFRFHFSPSGTPLRVHRDRIRGNFRDEHRNESTQLQFLCLSIRDSILRKAENALCLLIPFPYKQREYRSFRTPQSPQG